MMSKMRRLRHQIMVTTSARVPVIWLRHCGLDRADTVLASYPRSGNTWLRFMLAEIFSGHSTDFENIDRIIPEMGLQVFAHGVLPEGGRLVKTHERYRAEYRKAIYLVRDVRDVALSNHARECAVGAHFMTIDEYLPLFLAGKTSGFGSWVRHLRSWFESPLMSKGAIMVLRFEDLRRDTFGELSRVLTFLGYDIDPAQIRSAIANCSLERMRIKEDSAHTMPRVHDEAGRFVRTGSIGGWKDNLSESQLQLLDASAGAMLMEMGYPVVFGRSPNQQAV
jgi:sulfotransferase family protein